ncbi:uncharacterized protein FA14DRAFT_158802 [Meira miltonrushii]|uniref:Uncharacterized protein n=1 Tax=Meira miltonrushii TaxID=1280837 RepID=A0A316V1C1_9BASI|nr:uncharacterized protein FA14DRAFT_158802 [Meira miltonrushii]PWN31349.1 hypothetical protein FA14DRAFT_158802 [Meira miltonrushii]
MAQVSSFYALVKVVSHDLNDSTIGIDPAMLECYNGNIIEEPQNEFLTQLNAINNFTNNWETDNKFQHFNTSIEAENTKQHEIGSNLPKSSHTMLLWRGRLNSQEGSNKQFKALHDLHSEINSTIQKGGYFLSHTPTNDKDIDSSSALAASLFQVDVGEHITPRAPAETMCKFKLILLPFLMLNRGLQSIPHESQLQNLQESVLRELDSANADLLIKDVLSQTQSQDASTLDALRSFLNFNPASRNQQSRLAGLSTDAKKRWMEALLRESRKLEMRKSLKTSVDVAKSISAPVVTRAGTAEFMILCARSDVPTKAFYSTFTRRDNCTQHQKARHETVLVAHRIRDNES